MMNLADVITAYQHPPYFWQKNSVEKYCRRNHL